MILVMKQVLLRIVNRSESAKTETIEKGTHEIDTVEIENGETNEGDKTPSENVTEEIMNVVTRVPLIVAVHATTAIIDYRPSSVVTENEIDSLVSFLTSKDHLSRNIENVVYNVLPSREFRHEQFKNMVQVQLNLKTVNLWKSARG